MYEDSRGLIWIGTCEGLNVYNPKTDEHIFEKYDAKTVLQKKKINKIKLQIVINGIGSSFLIKLA